MVILALLNTLMTFGILVGVWWETLKPKTDFKSALNAIKKFIGKIVAASDKS